MGALTGHPWPLGHDAVSAYPRRRGQPSRGPRVPHHSPRPPHSRPGRPPDGRYPARAGAATQRGRNGGRTQRRVLRPSRARADSRRLRRRPRRPRGGAAARRDRDGRTSSTSPVPPTAFPPRAAPVVEHRASPSHDPASTGHWKRSRMASPSFETLTRTCSPPTPSAGRSTHLWSARVAGSRTWPGSSSSTPRPATSTPTGTCSPRCAWVSCAPKPAGTPTTADFKT